MLKCSQFYQVLPELWEFSLTGRSGAFGPVSPSGPSKFGDLRPYVLRLRVSEKKVAYVMDKLTYLLTDSP